MARETTPFLKGCIIPKEMPKHEALKAHAARYPGLEPSAVEALLALLRVAGEMFDAFREYFGRHGLSQGRFVLLVLLNQDPAKSLSPSDLADMAGVTRATITGLLDGLVSDGLVERIHLAGDRRSYSIRLTRRGKRFLDRFLPGHFKRIARLMAGLGERDRATLIQLLFRVREGLVSLEGPAAPVNARQQRARTQVTNRLWGAAK